MDTWIVSRNPVGVLKQSLSDTTLPEAEVRPLVIVLQQNLIPPQKITFFFKAHILAGQARPNEKLFSDFAWLTKQEIEARVDSKYWEGIKDILSDY